MSQRRGFTLLEVMVALTILSLALMAIFDLNAGAVAMHGYAKRVTVASMLARSKMIDLEQQLFDDGFSSDDDEEAGDFSKEGWPSFKWRARIVAPKTTGVSTEKLLGALFNLPVGGEGGGDVGMDAIAAMFAGAGAGGGKTPPGGAAGGIAALAGGAMAGMAQQQLTTFLDEITRTVREVHLTVSWKNGKEVETLDLVTHVVSMGKGSDRNGGAGAGTTSAPGASAPPGVYVRASDGVPISGQPLNRNGTYWDPENPSVQVVPQAQWQAIQAAQGGGLFPPRGGGKGPQGLPHK